MVPSAPYTELDSSQSIHSRNEGEEVVYLSSSTGCGSIVVGKERGEVPGTNISVFTVRSPSFHSLRVHWTASRGGYGRSNNCGVHDLGGPSMTSLREYRMTGHDLLGARPGSSPPAAQAAHSGERNIEELRMDAGVGGWARSQDL